MDRVQIITENIRKDQLVLEIGPSFRPLVKKKDGYNVKILDHATTRELIEKYKCHNIDTSDIEEVDYVFQGERIPELVKNERYDYILASHVIEHVPDLIGFLQDCETILKIGGEVRLAIPDKKFCFDYFRERTALSRVIDVHELGLKHQTAGAAAEYFLKVCKKNGSIAWNSDFSGEYTQIHSLEEAVDAIKKTQNGVYLDIHNWVFTPNSFRNIISDLKRLHYFNLCEHKFIETIGHEFFAFLKKI
jgi:2-polyprenyl-3-methyl-5-hydroxy-6-metoxy-1,4-benzoquinol methylase